MHISQKNDILNIDIAFVSEVKYLKPHLSLSQYRAMDLSFFCIMLVFSEGLINLAASKWFPEQPYTVSTTAAITAIVMVRWKGWGAIHALVGAVTLCVVLGASREQYIIYLAGNLLGLLGILLIAGKQRVRVKKSGLYAVFYGIVVLLLMQSGRALAALCFGYEFKLLLRFYATDSLSILFTALIIWIARRQDGLLEDQIDYIKRVQEEEEEPARKGNTYES